jgi:hypothetical protein
MQKEFTRAEKRHSPARMIEKFLGIEQASFPDCDLNAQQFHPGTQYDHNIA